jgi:hypothetical protein
VSDDRSWAVCATETLTWPLFRGPGGLHCLSGWQVMAPLEASPAHGGGEEFVWRLLYLAAYLQREVSWEREREREMGNGEWGMGIGEMEESKRRTSTRRGGGGGGGGGRERGTVVIVTASVAGWGGTSK